MQAGSVCALCRHRLFFVQDPAAHSWGARIDSLSVVAIELLGSSILLIGSIRALGL